MTAPRVGLVTVLYNSTGVLPDFFESLAQQDYPDFGLYVIDNSPDDASLRVAKALGNKHGFRTLSFVRNDENLGVAAANNQGIRLCLEAGCEYILLLNNDIQFPDPTLLSRMVGLADDEAENMIVPKIYYHDTGRIWCAGGRFNHWRGNATHYGNRKRDGHSFAVEGYTDYSPTCFMLIRRKVFQTVGLMDERFFVYYDDCDFVWRANKAGFKIRFWPKGKIWHKVSSSTGGTESLFSIYYSTRNRIFFIRKHFDLVHKVAAIAVVLATRAIKTAYYDWGKRARMWQALKDGFSVPLNSGEPQQWPEQGDC